MPVVLEEEIPLLKNEAEKIGVELHFQPYGEYNGIKLYKWVIDGWCPFYRGKCTIHEKKPLSCRMYPLVLNLKTGEVYLSEKCLWVKINGPKPLDHFPARGMVRFQIAQLRRVISSATRANDERLFLHATAALAAFMIEALLGNTSSAAGPSGMKQSTAVIRLTTSPRPTSVNIVINFSLKLPDRLHSSTIRILAQSATAAIMALSFSGCSQRKSMIRKSIPPARISASACRDRK